MRYYCPEHIKRLYEKDPEAAYGTHYNYLIDEVLHKATVGDEIEAPDGTWLQKTEDAKH